MGDTWRRRRYMCILKAVDPAFRNVVPEFETFVVASRRDVREVCVLLIVGLG